MAFDWISLGPIGISLLDRLLGWIPTKVGGGRCRLRRRKKLGTIQCKSCGTTFDPAKLNEEHPQMCPYWDTEKATWKDLP